MPSLLEILNDPNYTGENAATKQAIFDKYSAQDENYTGANDPTKQAIRERFGLVQPQVAPAQAVPAQPVPRPEDQSVFRQVADVPLNLTQGTVSGVRMVADALGANTAVSQNMHGVEDFLGGLMSAQAKNDKAEISRIMKAAEDKGVYEQVKAGVHALSVAPIDTLVNALGTSAPAIAAGLVATVAGAPAAVVTGVGLGIGSLMGAGTVKGTIYEDTKKALIDAGVDPKQADARAELAQQYNGKNLDSILVGTALGGLANITGLQPALAKTLAAKILGKAAATEAVESATAKVVERSYATIAKDLTKAGLKEGTPEFLQAFQERVASNVAQQREGLDIPTFRGAVAQGTLEGLAGLGLGTGVKAAELRGEQKQSQLLTDIKNTSPLEPIEANKDALIKQYQSILGISREEAGIIVAQAITENEVSAATAPKPAATDIPAGVDPNRVADIESELVNYGVDPVAARAGAIKQATQEKQADEAAEAEAAATQQEAPNATVSADTGVGTAPSGGGAAATLQQQPGASTAGATNAQPAGVGGAQAVVTQSATGEVAQPGALTTEQTTETITPAKPITPTSFAVKEVPAAESPTGKRAWNVTGPDGEILGTFDKKGDATAQATQARAAARAAAGQQPAGRKATLTPEQKAASGEQRAATQKASITATRTAETLKKQIGAKFEPSPNATAESVADELALYQTERLNALMQAYDISTNPAHRLNTAGKVANTHAPITIFEEHYNNRYPELHAELAEKKKANQPEMEMA